MDLMGQISLIGGNLSDFRANSSPMLWGGRKKNGAEMRCVPVKDND
jgi:hypothetical protein